MEGRNGRNERSGSEKKREIRASEYTDIRIERDDETDEKLERRRQLLPSGPYIHPPIGAGLV